MDDESQIEEWSKYDNVKTVRYGAMFGHCANPDDKFGSI